MELNYKHNPNGNCKLCANSDDWGKLVHCVECDRFLHQSCVEAFKFKAVTKGFVCPKCKKLAEDKKESREALMQTQKLLKEKIDRESLEREKTLKAEKEIERLQEEIKRGQEEAEITKSFTYEAGTNEDVKLLTEGIASMVKAWTTKNDKIALSELPEFCGSYKTWPRFKRMYDDTTKAGNFSDLENLTRLQKHLKGEALRSVSGLMLNPENVSNIIERLERLYGHPDNIYSALLNELLAIKNPSLERPAQFLSFSNALHDLINNMTMLDQHEYLNDKRLLKDLVARLPVELRNKWLADTLNKENKLTTLSDFATWLKPSEDLATVLVASEGESENNTHHITSKNCPRSRGCLLCGYQHETIRCKQLHGRSVDEKWRILKQRLRISIKDEQFLINDSILQKTTRLFSSTSVEVPPVVESAPCANIWRLRRDRQSQKYSPSSATTSATPGA